MRGAVRVCVSAAHAWREVWVRHALLCGGVVLDTHACVFDTPTGVLKRQKGVLDEVWTRLVGYEQDLFEQNQTKQVHVCCPRSVNRVFSCPDSNPNKHSRAARGQLWAPRVADANATRSHTPIWPSVWGRRGRRARNLVSLSRLSLSLSLFLSRSLCNGRVGHAKHINP